MNNMARTLMPRLPSHGVPTNPGADIALKPLGHPSHSLREWLTTFHLVVVVLDPYTHESAWLLDTAGRVLTNFDQADCRVGLVLTCQEDEARTFAGPWAQSLLCFADPDRNLVKGLALERLPALVHIAQDLTVVGCAEGWDPVEWRAVVTRLGEIMSWQEPLVPEVGDPAPFVGSPALG